MWFVGPNGKMTKYYREGAGCTMSDLEVLEAERELRQAEYWFEQQREQGREKRIPDAGVRAALGDSPASPRPVGRRA